MTTQTSEKPARGRRVLEVLFWAALISLLWGVDLWNKFAERARTGAGLDDFRLIVEQVTSGFAAFLMVGFVVFWLRQFPLDFSARFRPWSGTSRAA